MHTHLHLERKSEKVRTEWEGCCAVHLHFNVMVDYDNLKFVKLSAEPL